MYAPSIERKHPDIFCCTFVILKSFSPLLFVNGTNGLLINLRVSLSKSLNRSSRFLDFDFLIRPRCLGCAERGASGKGDSNSPAFSANGNIHFIFKVRLSSGVRQKLKLRQINSVCFLRY